MNIKSFVEGVVNLENSLVRQRITKQRYYPQIVREHLASARCFTFNYDTSPELVQFGMEMMERKAFALPYPICLFKFPCFENPERTIQEKKIGDCHVLVMEISEGNFYVISVLELIGQQPYCDAGGVFSWDGVKARDFDKISEFKDSLQKGEIPFSLPVRMDNCWTAFGDHLGPEKKSGFISELTHTCSGVIGLTASLMSRDVEIKEVQIPQKLQKSRAKKGKPPLRDYTEVKIKAEAIRKLTDNPEKGTHASPILHWRRGHWRKLSSGKIIPIAPCIVGARDENETPVQKSYQVRKSSEE